MSVSTPALRMIVAVHCNPIASSLDNAVEVKVQLTPETARECLDCASWRTPHLKTGSFVPDERCGDGALEKLESGPEALGIFDLTLSGQVLWGAPFCWNDIIESADSVGYRITLSHTPLAKLVIERLRRARCIDAVTIGIEHLLLESQSQRLFPLTVMESVKLAVEGLA